MAGAWDDKSWIKPYQEAVHKQVCSRCVDRTFDGACGLTGERACAFTFLAPQIVLAILSRSSNSFEDDLWSIRAFVCSTCKHQDATGHCSRRNSADCPLDRYLPLIIQTVRSVGLDFLPIEKRRSC